MGAICYAARAERFGKPFFTCRQLDFLQDSEKIRGQRRAPDYVSIMHGSFKEDLGALVGSFFADI